MSRVVSTASAGMHTVPPPPCCAGCHGSDPPTWSVDDVDVPGTGRDLARAALCRSWTEAGLDCRVGTGLSASAALATAARVGSPRRWSGTGAAGRPVQAQWAQLGAGHRARTTTATALHHHVRHRRRQRIHGGRRGGTVEGVLGDGRFRRAVAGRVRAPRAEAGGARVGSGGAGRCAQGADPCADDGCHAGAHCSG